MAHMKDNPHPRNSHAASSRIPHHFPNNTTSEVTSPIYQSTTTTILIDLEKKNAFSALVGRAAPPCICSRIMS